MVEALQVSIMTNGNLAQLPVHLNSYVLRLIEGFSNCREQLEAKNAAHEEAKRIQKDAFEDFEALAAEFRHREGQYKSEIRRLEVLLAQKTGLETVTLARTNSVLDRKQPYAENFVSGLQKRRSEAAVREAEARSAASQPVVSFLHGHSLSTDAEIMRVLDQGKIFEGIDSSEGKRRPSSSKYPKPTQRPLFFLPHAACIEFSAAATTETDAPWGKLTICRVHTEHSQYRIGRED